MLCTGECRIASHCSLNVLRQHRIERLTMDSCAAKHKSRKALRGDLALFDLLIGLEIHTTDTITTDLVIRLKDGTFKARSDRALIHYVVLDTRLRIYVPQDSQDRRACYRSHLPQLLASITGTGLAAMYDISNTVSCSMDELNDVLLELDITDVSWIAKPILDVNELEENEQPATTEDQTGSSGRNDDSSVAVVDRETSVSSTSASSRFRVASVPVLAINHRSSYDRDVAALEAEASRAQLSQYRQLLERLIAIARGTAYDVVRTFDNRLTFGGQGTDDFVFNRRIGAAGEAYVGLNLL